MSSSRTRRSSSRLVATVAVVDDDPSVRHAHSRILRAAGLKVTSFSTAEELLTVYESARPKCLVVDLNLPGMSGLDLAEKLRDTGQLGHEDRRRASPARGAERVRQASAGRTPLTPWRIAALGASPARIDEVSGAAVAGGRGP
jgi:CheY-like chemotaxis protein